MDMYHYTLHFKHCFMLNHTLFEAVVFDPEVFDDCRVEEGVSKTLFYLSCRTFFSSRGTPSHGKGIYIKGWVINRKFVLKMHFVKGYLSFQRLSYFHYKY